MTTNSNLFFFPERPALKQYYKRHIWDGQEYTYNEIFPMLQRGEFSSAEQNAIMRHLLENDLFLVMFFLLGRVDINGFDSPFLIERCKEVESGPLTDTVDLWAREHFKALDLETLVPTPGGWKKHGELRQGDYVFGSQGTTKKVIAQTNTFYDATCYRVTFDDGQFFVASGEHLWSVERNSRERVPNTNKRRGRVPELWSTKELFYKDHSAAKEHAVSRRFSVRLPFPYNIPDVELPIDPYVLGVWLGDGTTGVPQVTVGDEDIDEMISFLSHRIDCRIKSYSTANTIHVGNGVHGKKGSSDFRNNLRKIGVFKKKFIPEYYLWSSLHQRLELLQGLMDTDGHCDPRGTATFVNINERLANNVFQIASSLSLKPRFRKHYSKINGDKYPFYHVSFQAYKTFPPFKLKRKIEKCKDGWRHKPRRYIVSIEQVESVPVSCIQVEGDGQYLVGSGFVPTHNSSIITQGFTLQRILKNPNHTVGIFSFNKKIATDHMRPIKRALESYLARLLWPDRVWENPKSEAPSWSFTNGVILRRDSESNTCSLEAHGLVDSMPTGKHYIDRVYDDVITQDTVNTPDQMQRAEEAFKLSDNLGTYNGYQRIVGTVYAQGDYYAKLIREAENGIYPWKVRIHPWYNKEICKENNVKTPVLLSADKIVEKQKKQGSRIFAAQMELDPSNEENREFLQAWIRWYRILPERLNLYLLVDPANDKKKHSDWSAFTLVGLDLLGNRYLVDMVRDRLNLGERWNVLKQFVTAYPDCSVWYERYGMQSDNQHFEIQMREEGVYFIINEMAGQVSKLQRIRRLQPVFEQGKFYFPESGIIYHGEDIVNTLIQQEYIPFPFPVTWDMMDAMSRIEDPQVGSSKPINAGTVNDYWAMREQQLEEMTVPGI